MKEATGLYNLVKSWRSVIVVVSLGGQLASLQSSHTTNELNTGSANAKSKWWPKTCAHYIPHLKLPNQATINDIVWHLVSTLAHTWFVEKANHINISGFVSHLERNRD